MRRYGRGILLWLFGLDLGIAFGAGIYEGRVVVPQWENTPPQTWPNTGLTFWIYVTTVAPYAVHARESSRCLARPGTKALLVARRSRDHRRGAECDVLLLHSDDDPADGYRGFARSGGQGHVVAVEASELRPSCPHPGGVVGSTKGAVVANQVSVGADPVVPRVRRSAFRRCTTRRAGNQNSPGPALNE